jgi:hypothetical protein
MVSKSLEKEFARLGERLGLANYLDDEDRNDQGVLHNMQGSQASSDSDLGGGARITSAASPR